MREVPGTRRRAVRGGRLGNRRLLIALAGTVTVLLVAGAIAVALRGGVVPRWGTPDRPDGAPTETAELAAGPGRSAVPLPTKEARRMGEKVAIAGIEATAYSYRQPSAVGGKASMAGYEWAALDVEVCARAGTMPTSWQPWSLVYADGATAVTKTPAGPGETPAFPNHGRPLGRDACARGWIMFAVPMGERPRLVELQPSDGAANWIVPSG